LRWTISIEVKQVWRHSTLPTLLILFCIGGCVADRWYSDPANSTAGYEDLTLPHEPLELRLRTVITNEGYYQPSANLQRDLRRIVERVLHRSGLIKVSDDARVGLIEVWLEVDPASASQFERRGSGARIVWNQMMTVQLDLDDVEHRRQYLHSILIYRGKASEPAGLPPAARPRELVEQAVETMLLRALRDLQHDSLLPAGRS
jgi:hypothetical protein